MAWSNWRSIDNPSRRVGAAVYKIRVAIAKHPMKISRFLGVDRTGLLSIGMTGQMEARRKQFLSGVKKGKGHSEGNLFHLLLAHAGVEKKLGSFRLEYSFQPMRTRKSAARLEADLLKRYVRRFGEAPPLNSIIPNLHDGQW